MEVTGSLERDDAETARPAHGNYRSDGTIRGYNGERRWSFAFCAIDIDKKTAATICGAVLEGQFRFLSKYQYELTINPEVQQDHARRGGFLSITHLAV